jgi:uncharacterized protein
VTFRGIGIALLVFGGVIARGAEVMPPQPHRYFNDFASLVSPATAQALNDKLEQFERSDSSQILVVIYPTMQSDSSIDDYATRLFRSWGVGQKGKNNGAVLFVFSQSRQMWISTGYGLEATLTDALCKRIVSEQIIPAFKKGDYDGGLSAAVDSMIAATRGEYKGTGQTVNDRSGDKGSSWVPFVAILLFIVISSIMRSRAAVYGNGRRRGFGGFIPIIFPGGGGGFGGGGGGGGGFSGGGGMSGGGGAGGSW